MDTRAYFKLAVTSFLVTPHLFVGIAPMWNPLDPVNSFLSDLAKALREWYAALLQSIIDLVTMVSLPPPETLVNDFFSLALGGTYGLARIVVALIAVLVAIVIVLSPTARHGVKVQRALVSLLFVLVLGWVFYPIYGLFYHLSKAGVEAASSLGKVDTETAYDAVMRLFSTVNIADAISTIFAAGISGVFGIFLIGIAVGLFISSIILMIFYPLAIAVRPLGAFGNNVFNAFNAMIITTLVSPTIMTATFLLPLYIQKYMSTVALVAAPFFALVGSLVAVATPITIFFLSYKKSSEVFGRLDDASGRMDIGHMPAVSVEEVQNDVQVTQNMSTTAIVADALSDSLLYGGGGGDLFDDMVKKGVDIAATATTAAGHPYIGVGLKAAGGMYSNIREHGQENDSREGGETRV